MKAPDSAVQCGARCTRRSSAEPAARHCGRGHRAWPSLAPWQCHTHPDLVSACGLVGVPTRYSSCERTTEVTSIVEHPILRAPHQLGGAAPAERRPARRAHHAQQAAGLRRPRPRQARRAHRVGPTGGVRHRSGAASHGRGSYGWTARWAESAAASTFWQLRTLRGRHCAATSRSAARPVPRAVPAPADRLTPPTRRRTPPHDDACDRTSAHPRRPSCVSRLPDIITTTGWSR